MKKIKLINAFAFIIFCIFIILPLFACTSENTDEDDGIYTISSAEDLVSFSESVNGGKDYSGQTVNQTCDIDLNGIEFIPIGLFDSNNYFYGTYNGNGYTINNLYIDYTENGSNNGLFGQLGGTVMNVNLNGYIFGNCCGSFASHAITSKAKIVNCHSSVIISANRCGGIADNFIGYIYGCSYYNELISLPIVGYDCAGIECSYSNAEELFPDTFEGENKNNCIVTSSEQLEEYVNQNLAATAASSGISINKLTKYESTNTSSFIDSLLNYPANTLKAYAYYIIAIVLLTAAVIDIVITFIVEMVKYNKNKRNEQNNNI